MLRGLLPDLRYAVRVLARSRVFTAVAVLSLAFGIGANVAIFSVIRALLIDPLPVHAPEELRLVYWRTDADLRISQTSSSGHTDPDTGLQYRSNYSYPIYDAARRLGEAGIELAGFNFVREIAVSNDDQPAVSVGGVTADGRYFSVLRPAMAIGRALDEGDDDVSRVPVAAVISHRLWLRLFGGDPAILGRSIRVNGVPASIVGVTAKEFTGLSKAGGFYPQTEITFPLRALPAVMPRWQPENTSLLASERHFWVRLVARGRAGANWSAAESRLASIVQSHIAPLRSAGTTSAVIRALPGARGLDQTGPEARRLLLILMGVVGVVLLVACANLASLMLARGAARQREMCVRQALGAGRFRLARQLLLEGVCLALAGGAVGLFLTFVGRRGLTTLLTAGLGRAPLSTQSLEVTIDAPLVAVTLGLSLAASLVCSLLPAIRLTRMPEVTPLKLHAVAASAPKLHTARWLIVGQIAASVPLLVAAVLLLRTLSNLSSVELGFNPESLVLFRVDPAAAGQPRDRHAAIYQQVLSRLGALPGVTSATLIENVFMSGIMSSSGVTVNGEGLTLLMNAVGPDFAQTFGLRVLAGRMPGIQDGPNAPAVAAINETAARRFFGAAAPVGHTLDLGGRLVQVVGVVNDTLYDRRRSPVRPVMFDSALQRPGFGGHHVVLRTTAPAASLEAAIRRAVSDVHRDLPVPEIRSQVAQLADSVVRERTFTQTLTLFGAFALLLASIGLYGVTAYAVSRRRSEIGLRMALGAQRRQVLWLVLRQVIAVTCAGLAIGILLAMQVTSYLQSLLYGVAPTDLSMFAVAAGAMLVVAIAAGAVPAHRASRTDPLVTLRTE